MSNFKQESDKKIKQKPQSNEGPEFLSSQQQIYCAASNGPKTQQKKDITQKNKKQQLNTLIDFQRRNPKIINSKPNNKHSKRNKKTHCQDHAHEGDQMIKKQTRKNNAAPPQLANDGSNSSSLQSQKSQKSQQQKAAPDQPKQSIRLYVGNLPVEFSESQMKKLFKKYGNIKQAKLVINNITGKSKGFGFVQYIHIESAIKAKQELITHIIDGQKISIQFCEKQ